jgi:hypothetical protein
MKQTAVRLDHRPEFIERSVAEQLALNRGVVAVAEDDRLKDAIHPARWERCGLFQRLRRRTRLSSLT